MENWKPVVGYEGFYEVSDYGRVRSVAHEAKSSCRNGGKRVVPSRVLKANKRRNGYLKVDLCKEGKTSSRNVHRLVADAFLGEQPQLQVNHKNLNKCDNRLSNLEWVAPSENMAHARANGAIGPSPLRKQLLCKEKNLIFPSSYQAAEWVNANDKSYSGNIPAMARCIRRAATTGGTSFGYRWIDLVEQPSTTIP